MTTLRDRLKLASGPLLAFAAGYAAVQALLAFLGNGSPDPVPIALLMGGVVVGGYLTGWKILGALAAEWAGVWLTAKPFFRPIAMKSGYVLSPTTDTHLHYIIPGVLLVVAASITLAMARRGEKKLTEGPLLRALTAAGLALGIAIAAPHLFEETKEEAIARYRPRFAAIRESWKDLHAKLPPPETPVVEKLRPDLTPKPILNLQLKVASNTEIVAAEQLLDPQARVTYELFAAGWVKPALAWTGPDNPMAESVLYERAGDLIDRLEEALAYRYLVVYRPGGDGMDVFMFDVKTSEIVVALRTARSTSFSENQLTLARELERATGGIFDLD